MSLLKIPFLLSTVWGMYIMFTPPNPPPSPKRRVKPTGLEAIIPRYAPPAIKIATMIPQLIETCAIIACRLPGQGRLYGFAPCRTNCHDLHLSPTFTIASLVAFAGALIRLATYRHMGTMFTFELGRSYRLVTSGPYSVVRHPSYSGAALAVSGTIVCILDRGSWLMECTGLGETWSIFGWAWGIFALLVTFTIRRMGMEDDLLREGFGKEWQDWAGRVPYKLVPGMI